MKETDSHVWVLILSASNIERTAVRCRLRSTAKHTDHAEGLAAKKARHTILSTNNTDFPSSTTGFFHDPVK